MYSLDWSPAKSRDCVDIKKHYPVENFLTIPKVTIDKEDSFTIASNWLKSLLGKPDITPRSLRPMLPQPLRITPYSTEMFHLLIYAFQGPRPANPDLVWVDLQTANSMCEDGRIIDLVTYFAIKMYILDRPNKS